MSNCIFAFALQYQQELVLWQSGLNSKIQYAESLEYSDKLLLTQLFGEFACADIIAVYPKDFYSNNSIPLILFTNLGLFCKTELKYSFFISYYNAEFSIIRKEAANKFVLPVRCRLSDCRFQIETSSPILLRELVSIVKNFRHNIKYWVQQKQPIFCYANPAYYVKRSPWNNLEKQFAYNESLPSSTAQCFILPENQFESEQCAIYQNTRFARGTQELITELDKLFCPYE